ncbi:hypothetical protein LCGC14_0322810 [marine sediment metagenome]|uniref:Uncharacterized protein n=1 Tax=marine sediment metagenome TaxID=412755 RepID=A0A0F9U175_9ZZZZ
MADPTANLGELAITGGPGRPKGSKNKATRYRALIDEAMSQDDERAIWQALIGLAKGCSEVPADVIAARLIMEYRYGKPRQVIEADVNIGLQELVFTVVPMSNESETNDGDPDP